MNEDPSVGRFLESLTQAGGYLQTLVPIDGLSQEVAYEAAQRAVMLGYATSPAMTGANGLPSTLFDVRITPAGKDHLQQHRRTSPPLVDPTAGPGEGRDSSLEARTARRIQFIKAVYEESNSSEASVMDGFDLGSRLGWPYPETNDVMQYWEAVARGYDAAIRRRGGDASCCRRSFRRRSAVSSKKARCSSTPSKGCGTREQR